MRVCAEREMLKSATTAFSSVPFLPPLLPAPHLLSSLRSKHSSSRTDCTHSPLVSRIIWSPFDAADTFLSYFFSLLSRITCHIFHTPHPFLLKANVKQIQEFVFISLSFPICCSTHCCSSESQHHQCSDEWTQDDTVTATRNLLIAFCPNSTDAPADFLPLIDHYFKRRQVTGNRIWGTHKLMSSFILLFYQMG